MRPSVVLLGFVLGSAGAITFGLLGVAVVFTWLLPEYPRLENELPTLWRTLRMGCQVYQPLYGMDLAALCRRSGY